MWLAGNEGPDQKPAVGLRAQVEGREGLGWEAESGEQKTGYESLADDEAAAQGKGERHSEVRLAEADTDWLRSRRNENHYPFPRKPKEGRGIHWHDPAFRRNRVPLKPCRAHPSLPDCPNGHGCSPGQSQPSWAHL